MQRQARRRGAPGKRRAPGTGLRPGSAPVPGEQLLRSLRLQLRFQDLLVFAREFDETRREARIFVDGVAMIIAGDHLGSRLVRHGRGHCIEAHVQQIRDHVLERAPGKELREACKGADCFFQRSSNDLNFTATPPIPLRESAFYRVMAMMSEPTGLSAGLGA